MFTIRDRKGNVHLELSSQSVLTVGLPLEDYKPAVLFCHVASPPLP